MLICALAFSLLLFGLRLSLCCFLLGLFHSLLLSLSNLLSLRYLLGCLLLSPLHCLFLSFFGLRLFSLGLLLDLSGLLGCFLLGLEHLLRLFTSHLCLLMQNMLHMLGCFLPVLLQFLIFVTFNLRTVSLLLLLSL